VSTLAELSVARIDDPHRNLTLDDYEPLAPPAVGALRPTAVIARALELVDAPAAAADLLAGLQSAFGYGRLVWSFSLREQQPAWELYVYNGMVGERIAPAELEQAMSRWLEWAPGLSEAVGDADPYSIDLDLGSFGGDRVGHLNGYVNAGEEAALSYRLTVEGPQLQNVYRRFPSEQGRRIDRAINRTLHLRSAVEIEQFAPSEHLEVHIAQKPFSDGIYWIGVPTRSLVEALAPIAGAELLCAVLRPALDRLEHLRFDMGLDLQRRGDALLVTKVGLYGLL
jgi:hypothetical protein